MQKNGKMDVCNFFLAFCWLSPRSGSQFFLNKIHYNDPGCNALMKGKERLSEQDKQGLGSSKPLI